MKDVQIERHTKTTNSELTVNSNVQPIDAADPAVRTREEDDLILTKDNVLDAADPGLWTYRVCTIGLGLMWLTGIGVIVYGAIVQAITDSSIGVSMHHHKALGPFLRLAVAFWVTSLSDIAGLVHSTSLRFALLAARKLTFNSNLRLFTSCPSSRVHWWPVNLLWAWSLISSYACGSMVILETIYTYGSDDSNNADATYDVVSGYALIFLGFGLLGQASVATWALIVNKFPTWSTNPIYVAAVCQSQGWMSRLSHRSMLSVHDAQDTSLREPPTLPKLRQGSLLKAHFRVRRVLILVWIVTFLAFVWFAALCLAYQLRRDTGPAWGSFSRSLSNDWSLIPNYVDTTAFIGIPTSLGQSYFSFGPWFVCKYLLTCAFVSAITLSLHIVELLVQASRDESLWRQTASASGLRPKEHGAIYAAVTSWQTVALFVLKCLIHWIFGMAFGLMWEGIEIRIPQVLYTAITLLLLAVMATRLALYRPNGPQPAAFGHLPTLIHLIDVWHCKMPGVGDADQVAWVQETAASEQADQVTLYWGDKGEDIDGFRRAGTAFTPLNPIVMTALYL
ncbi:uncharacterized protein Z518_02159 [Rhinocladiella mackenziei CBS 650.93]|uniref:Rhinocladiella mackenziei CBS 650.93 unplaced genomic scaffold supercont1.2, whole genome shotgun sequence n=1 Tax=Rhinocladiella mackenziei CBS 650.93 TaxID=1442369 RepID=A0A0D2IW86_9EURO|nr:uncharacterized protein Z518_02159 [Rhinocladiella mackenziei CBS 650.93]KIX07506.1 hypothetical protein Z518_02159 [Rhinocladiella mackenziei CBS 650.93]